MATSTSFLLLISNRYRFVELYYRRSESIHKGRTIPARVETVVIYLPDVRSCLPTRIEWDGLSANYKQKMEEVIKASESGTDGADVPSSSKNNESSEKGPNDGAEANGIADSNTSVAVGASSSDADAANDKAQLKRFLFSIKKVVFKNFSYKQKTL